MKEVCIVFKTGSKGLERLSLKGFLVPRTNCSKS